MAEYAVQHLGNNASGACATQASGGIICTESFNSSNGSVSITLVTEAAEEVEIEAGDGTVVVDGAAGQDVAVAVFEGGVAGIASGDTTSPWEIISDVVDVVISGNESAAALVTVTVTVSFVPVERLLFGTGVCEVMPLLQPGPP